MDNIVMLDASIRQKLIDIVGPHGWRDQAKDIEPFLLEWRDRWRGESPIVLLPNHTEQIQRILELCHRSQLPIVPQGGNTGLVGGGIPQGEICLSMKRLNRECTIFPREMVAIVDAGFALAQLDERLAAEGLMFPVSIASKGSATIGGMAATNAGGVHVLRYGMMRDRILGLEAVMADGAKFDDLTRLSKDNTGYDLKQLLIGSEGTLGVMTKLALRLAPIPRQFSTALVALNSAKDALILLQRQLFGACDVLCAFELMNNFSLSLVSKHLGAKPPFSLTSPYYALIEWSSGDDVEIESGFECAIQKVMADDIVSDAAIAQSNAQRNAFWALRENISDAQKREGPSLKHDISVPLSEIPRLVDQGVTIFEEGVPNSRPCLFGHVGDGNLHFNLSAPENMDRDVFLRKRDSIEDRLFELVCKLGGSISAEHGIGVARKQHLRLHKSAKQMQLMREMKKVLDPKNILNPRTLF